MGAIGLIYELVSDVLYIYSEDCCAYRISCIGCIITSASQQASCAAVNTHTHHTCTTHITSNNTHTPHIPHSTTPAPNIRISLHNTYTTHTTHTPHRNTCSLHNSDATIGNVFQCNIANMNNIFEDATKYPTLFPRSAPSPAIVSWPTPSYSVARVVVWHVMLFLRANKTHITLPSPLKRCALHLCVSWDTLCTPIL